MLKIECPACERWVESPYLAEVGEMSCPLCAERVTVKDVFVSAGPYSMYREVLIRHIFRYQRLLKEAEQELSGLLMDGKGLKAYNVSPDTIKSLIGHLKEMLAGCRSGYRIYPEDKFAIVASREGRMEGRLLNLSKTGACINIGENAALLGKSEEVSAGFYDGAGDFSIRGSVVWKAADGGLGLRFHDFDSATEKRLLSYMGRSAAAGEHSSAQQR